MTFTPPSLSLARSAVLVALAAASLLPPEANAACPGVFAGASCKAGGTYDICGTDATQTIITCSMDINGGTANTTGYFISPSAVTFRAYGYEANGATFCCEMAVVNGCAGPKDSLTVYGTVQQDSLYLSDVINGGDMDCSTSYVNGDDDSDTLYGSRSLTNDDIIHGDSDEDTIRGQAGLNDWLYGDGMMDDIRGGTGVDHISGGNGADTILGDAGADIIYGDDGTDHIKGGAGNDVLHGGNDDDEVCGGADNDTIYGEDGSDHITGESGADTNDGGTSNNDYCENDGMVNCEHVDATCPF